MSSLFSALDNSILSLLIVLISGFSYAEVIDTDKTIKVDKYITDSIDVKDEADYFSFRITKTEGIVRANRTGI